MNKFEYKNLTPFKWFVLENFPFIEADFDALTDWQLYCKLGKEINKIIDSQNVVGTQMENVTNAFIELQNYVDNYFDNLDVQDEINNKLNEMAEDGTLQEIISAYLNSKAVFGFDNVESMKNATNLTDGSYAQTLGYHIRGDGGSSLYKIRSINENDEIDNATLIKMKKDNLVAELTIKNNTINVKQFGCFGDGINDDSENLQKSIDYAISNNYKIYIDKSNYLINTTLNLIGNNIILECDGELITQNEIVVLYIKGEQNNILINTIKQNSSFKGTAILSDGLNRSNIQINNIINFNKGISLDTSQNNDSKGIYYNKIYSNYINSNYCIYCDANYQFINSNYFYLSLLNGKIGIYTNKINNPNNKGEYNGNYFENMGFEHIETCVELHNSILNEFSNFRLIESVTGDYFFKLLDNSGQNVFTSSSVSALMQNNKIQDTQSKRDFANKFNMNITQYGNRKSQYANKVITYNNIVEITENNNLPNFTYIEDQNYTFSPNNMDAITEIGFSNNGNDVNIYLDERFNYNNYYLNNLTVYVAFMSAVHEANVFDSKGNKILNIKDDYLSTHKITAGGKGTFKFYLRMLPDGSSKIIPYQIK